jgi:uncharacterized membrane protein
MVRKILLILFVLVLIANTSFAADIKTHQTAFNIVNNKIVVETDILFNEKTTAAYEFELPTDYNALSVYIDDDLIYPEVQDNILKLNLKANSKISFNYVTKEFIDKTNFLMNMKLDFDVDNLIIKLVLPEGASLKKPMSEGDLTSGSIYPNPTKATTDGRSLMFYWLRKDMKQGDEISIFTQIQPKTNYLPYILIASAVLLLAIGLAVFYKPKKSKSKVVVSTKPTKVIVEREDMVEKHLKPDEEQIVNVLKQREGSCEQGTLRVVTGFSKATLSRLLKELEDRKVVYKEKRGKKNLVFLKK